MSNLPEMKAPAGWIYRREKRDFGEYYDREELITCEDCKYYETRYDKPICVNHYLPDGEPEPHSPDDYCSDAKRR